MTEDLREYGRCLVTGGQGKRAVEESPGFSGGGVRVDAVSESGEREGGEQCAGRDIEFRFAREEFEKASGGNA